MILPPLFIYGYARNYFLLGFALFPTTPSSTILDVRGIHNTSKEGSMEEFSVLLIMLGIVASIFLLVLWIMLPIFVYKISGKMDKIIARLDRIVGKIQ